MTLQEPRAHLRHDMRETSMEAWRNLFNMGEMQRLVYDRIFEDSRKGVFLTDREIARDLALEDPNAVRPRRYELMQLGINEEAEVRECSVTHRKALTWKVRDAVCIVRFEGNRVVQLKALSYERWSDLHLLLKEKGYNYVGNGVWEKKGC
jgi:hypothetical protein